MTGKTIKHYIEKCSHCKNNKFFIHVYKAEAAKLIILACCKCGRNQREFTYNNDVMN